MKKLGTLLAFVFTLCFILIGCAPVESLTLSSIPWPAIEEVRYTIHDQAGDTIGSGNLTISKAGETYVLRQYWQLKQITQTISIEVTNSDLKPISGSQTIVSPQNEIKINTTYNENKLRIDAETPQGPKTVELDIPANAYDNDEVLFLFRALPFKEGYQSTYTNVVASSAQMPEVTIRVTGKEQVQTPIGSLDCWKLELAAAGKSQYMWYGVDSPHYLVKYDDGYSIISLQEIVQ